MNGRLKQLRKALNLKQGDFAAALSISQGHLSDVENGRKEVSDRIISICSLKFNANEEWLKTGKGDMFNPMSEDEELDKAACAPSGAAAFFMEKGELYGNHQPVHDRKK